MDDTTFDQLVKDLAQPRSRRSALKRMGATLAGVIGASAGIDRAAAAAKRSAGNACRFNSDCATNRCVSQGGSSRKLCACIATDDCPNPGLCTSVTCIAGVCEKEAIVTCAALDDCHAAGECDGRSGICSNPQQPHGAACSDGNPLCLAGSCCTGSQFEALHGGCFRIVGPGEGNPTCLARGCAGLAGSILNVPDYLCVDGTSNHCNVTNDCPIGQVCSGTHACYAAC